MSCNLFFCDLEIRVKEYLSALYYNLYVCSISNQPEYEKTAAKFTHLLLYSFCRHSEAHLLDYILLRVSGVNIFHHYILPLEQILMFLSVPVPTKYNLTNKDYACFSTADTSLCY